MNWTGRVFWSLVLFGTALTASPAVAVEPNAVLYEVTEEMNFRSGKLVRRLAVAALSGTVNAGTSLCPDWLASAMGVASCSITAIAHNNVVLSTGQGPVSGTFAIVVQDNNTVDGPELVIARGTLDGRIDLSPAVLFGVPIGTMTGTWSASGVRGGPMDGFRGRGTLFGTFRLPFNLAGHPAYMLDPGGFAGPNPSPVPGTHFVFVNPFDPNASPKSELSLGVPTVRLEVTFVDMPRSRRSRHDDD